MDNPKIIETDPWLLKPVNDLGLTVRTVKYLKSAKILLVGDLIQRSESELLKLPNLDKKILVEIKSKLSDRGLTLVKYYPLPDP